MTLEQNSKLDEMRQKSDADTAAIFDAFNFVLKAVWIFFHALKFHLAQ